MTHTKDEALKLASALDHWATQMDMGRKPDPKSLTRKASAELRRLQAELDAIKQSLAQPAPVQGLPFGVGGGLVAIKTLLGRDPCVHANTAIEMIDAILNTHPAAQPAVPDAIHHTDTSETLEYIEGWNDCRTEMLKGMK
jgi:hypothetical protein